MKHLLSYQLIEREAPTILFLHGFLGNASQWDFLVDHYRESYQILLCELPGHGDNKIAEKYTIDDLADDLAQVLVQLDIKSVHFVGHSMGGYVGCAFATAYPDQILSLHLINSCATEDTVDRKSQRDRSIKLVTKHPEAFVQMAINNLFSSQEKAQLNSVINNMKVKASEINTTSIAHAIGAMRDRKSQLIPLKNSSILVQYIHGVNDIIIPLSVVKEEALQFNGELSILDSGHMSLLTHRKEIKNILLIEKLAH